MVMAAEPFVLAVDVGTSSLKAVVYARGGAVCAASTQRYENAAPQAGWAEADPEDWWAALLAAANELRKDLPDLGSVEALALTGQMHTLVLLDEDLQVAPPTMLWLDRRASAETSDLQQAFHLPPYHLNTTYSLPKLVWLARHRPEVMARVRHVLWAKDFLRLRLTGRLATDRTEAGGAALLDWQTLDWARERLGWAGIDPEILPPLLNPTDDAGPLLPEAARLLGLRPDVRVLTGVGDVLALVTGAPRAEGRICCSMGSSSMVFGAIPQGKDLRDPLDRIYTYPLLPYRLLGGVTSTSGAAVQWAYRSLYSAEMSFEAAIVDGLSTPPGADGLVFLPFLSGERSPYWSDRLRGAYYGLTLAHTRAHMLRAVMEGVVYSLRRLVEIFEETGFKVEEIALAGGGALIHGFPRLVAEICERPVVVYTGQETVTNGLYAYACQALDPTVSFEQALERTFQQPEIVRPTGAWTERYSSLYRQYIHLAEFAGQAIAGLDGPPG
jgi:xylulokinase